MCRIFKCNRAGKYIGFYNRLEDAMRDNPMAQRDWFFTNGETLSVWMFDGNRWLDTNRAVGAVNMIDNPGTFVPDVLAGESKTYFYIAPQAGEYIFTNFGGISVSVEKPSLISMDWNGIEWGDTICEFPVHGEELLPEVELRFVSLPNDDVSEVYGGRESNIIKNCYVEFRMSQGWDFINREKENIYLCLNRWKSKNMAGKSTSHRRWVTVYDNIKSEFGDLSHCYPNKGESLNGYYRYEMKGIPFWTQSRIKPVAFSDLIVGEYHGEWIRIPYSMESIMRRFIYMRNQKSEHDWEVVPPQKFFDSSGRSAEMVCSGGKMKMSHDEGHANFVSLTLGLCLAIKDLSVTNYEKWIKGCMTAFCGRMGYTQKLGLFYNATLYGKNRFVK